MTSSPVALTTALIVPESRRALLRLVRSRDRWYPDLQLLIAWDEPFDLPRVDWAPAGADDSVNTRYNALLARVRTPYCVVASGAPQWRRGSRLPELVAPLAENQFDLVAGATIACQRRWIVLTSRQAADHSGSFGFGGDQLSLTAKPARKGVTCATDFAGPYFAARTDTLRVIGGWDGDLRPAENVELYVRAARFDLRVGVCYDASIWQWQTHCSDANQLRPLAVERMGVTRLVDVDGRAVDAPQLARAA